MTSDPHRVLDTLAKWVAPIGVVALLLLQSQFVGHDEFNELSSRVESVETLLIRMEGHRETDARHTVQLADHETRIRNLEIQ